MSWLKLDVILFMAVYGALVGLILLGKRKTKIRSNALRGKNQNSSSEKISVVIPFRNEAENLQTLIFAIQQLNASPLEFIFVDDHSEDESLEKLQNAELNFRHGILELTENEFGKKAAIRKGISVAKGNYILTWDADILPDENYFLALTTFRFGDLNILPVEMRDSGWVAGFFAWDYQLQTQTALSLAGFYRPITASGANLLFDKKAFVEGENQRNDTHFLSGDDQFLLSALRNQGKSIQNIEAKELTVTTNAPQTIAAGLQQRSRWLGKSKAVNDRFANLFGLVVLILQLTYYSFAFYQLSIGNFGATIVMILIKGELDAFVCSYKFQEQFNSFQVFLYELLFPVYILILLFLSFYSSPRWKGRSVKKPFYSRNVSE